MFNTKAFLAALLMCVVGGGITSSSGAVLSRYNNKGNTGQTSVEVQTCREKDRGGAYISFSDATQSEIKNNCRELLAFFDEIISLMKEYFLEFRAKGHEKEDVDKEYDNACYSAAQNNNYHLSKWVELMEQSPQSEADRRLVEDVTELKSRNINMCEAMEYIIKDLTSIRADIEMVKNTDGDHRLI